MRTEFFPIWENPSGAERGQKGEGGENPETAAGGEFRLIAVSV